MSVRRALLHHDLERAVARIRAFERGLLALFERGELSGTVHTCIGQEGVAAALGAHLDPARDAVFATHRGHGLYLCCGGPADALLAELLGREGALCGGRGGSQHLRHQRFFSTGIQGATAQLAVGYAWALRRRGEQALAVAQLGDGTLGEGAVYESLQLAAMLELPVLFVIECNGWAMSTDVGTTTRGDLAARMHSFGIDADRRDDRDPEALCRHLGEVVARVRGGRPFVQLVDTRRLAPHSKGDDVRPPEVLSALAAEDPFRHLDLSTEAAAFERLADEVRARPAIAPRPFSAAPRDDRVRKSSEISATDRPCGRICEELNRALRELMRGDPDVILAGQDIADPLGGAFRVTRGLSREYPDRVVNAPLAEATLVGAAAGLAAAGLRPIVEIMFADFATLAVDALVNQAAKLHAVWNTPAALTVRLASGGGRGYGPTHSQPLESLLFGIPGLRVVILSHRHDPARLLTEVVRTGWPTVFVEPIRLYPERPSAGAPLDLRAVERTRRGGDLPPLCYALADGGSADLTMVATGAMAPLCEQAMQTLLVEDERRFDYMIVTQPWPLDAREIIESARRTRRVVVVEEGVATFGLGAAVAAEIAREAPGATVRCVGSRPAPIPCARPLEDAVLPSAARIVRAARAEEDPWTP